MKKILAVSIVLGLIFSMKSLAVDLFQQIRDEDEKQSIIQAPAPASPTDANYSMKNIPIYYINANEVKDTLTNLLAPGEGVSVNNSTNSVIIRAAANNIIRVEKMIKSLDRAPLQVHVAAKIIEVTNGSGDNSTPSTFGFSWQYLTNAAGNNFAQFIGSQPPTADSVATGMYAQVLKSNVKAYFAALEKRGNYDIVASPSITALNHQEATIFIGGKIGYRLLLTTQTGTLQNVSYLETGTKLRFVPHITNDGYIKMEIYPSVSEGNITDDGLPIETTTETKNWVLAKNGETIVIAGLTKNYKTKTEIGVPYLSAIPLIGNFFKRTELVQQKKEIIVTITPNILTPEVMKTMRTRVEGIEKEQNKKIDDTNLIH